jgi:TRAP-type C4-dicarboxylate transport system substrate-binding protein
VYTSLQQGVLDGSELSIELVTAFKFNEVAKYYTETAHNGTPGMVLTNLAWWNKQPKIVQDLIEDVIQKNYRKTNDEFYANVDPFSTQQQQTLAAKVLTEKGVTMVKPDIVAFKKASSPVIDQFKAKIGKDYVESVLKAVGY